ncbi:uncharacterized protein LOC122816739 [Protopterus annectens]|uniref:uncharacterized protein LOC122816739 n=1 Tax=Protopterus annectens TaxID=7888 RepID=UPI001CFBA239|nr:uncharacterized protein LOC122816739 [Protopterus annectens]
MGFKKNLLFVFAIFILSGCPVQSTQKCPKDTVDRTTYCSGAFETIDVSEVCPLPLREAACANNNNVEGYHLEDYIQCYANDSKTILDTDGFRILFSEIPVDTIADALDIFTNEIPGVYDTPMEGRAVLLRGIWDRLQSTDIFMTKDFLTTWFQVKLKPLLPAIPREILNCMTLYPLSCDSMQIIVQALDDVYTSMDNAEQTVVASWITETLNLIGCTKKSSSAWISAFWKSFSKNAKYSDFIRSWSDFDGYAVANIMTAKQLAELTAKTNGLQKSTKTRAIIQTLNDNNIDYVAEYLDSFSTLADQMHLELSPNLCNMMLRVILYRLNTTYPERCSPSLDNWFQDKLRPFMFAADARLLNLLPSEYSCKEFQAIYKGIDTSSAIFNADFQKAEFNAKLQFLNSQLQNTGSACTYLSSGTSEWLHANFGPSSLLASYSDFKRLYPDFDALQVVNDLTATQLADATIDLNLLGAASTPYDSAIAEAKITIIMDSLNQQTFSDFQEYLTQFLKSASKENIQSIQNEKVRFIMWTTIFDKLTEKMDNFITADWENWFQLRAKLFTPSIKPEQLSEISTNNCLDFQAIVLGLDAVYEEMTQKTQEDIAKWIVTFLGKKSCDSSDWFTLNWRRFGQNANLLDIITVKPDFNGFKYLAQLNATQIADLTLISGALTSVASTNTIFKKLADDPGNTDLAAYWDRINSSITQSNTTIDISKDVSDVMLTKTLEQLRSSMLHFTAQDYKIWTQHRLPLVLHSISITTLKYIPSNIPCDSLKELTAGLNQVYLYFPESSKQAVTTFIVSALQNTIYRKKITVDSFCSTYMTFEDWLFEIFGHFSMQAEFSQLNLYRDGIGNPYEILHLLTPVQTGDMILMSDTLERIPLVNKLFDFLETRPVSHVRATIRQFTARAKQEYLVHVPQLDVAKLMLQRYMLIISTESNTYNSTTWEDIFDNEVFYFISVFSETTLQYIVVDNCAQLEAIVHGLGIGYDDMSLISLIDVVAWITSSLNKINGCKEIPPEIWASSVWDHFVNRVSLLAMEEINPKFEPSQLLHTLTVSQLSEYTVISDALTNVAEIERVLNELLARDDTKISNINLYLALVYRYAVKHNVTGISNISVRDKMLNTLFPYVISNLDTMTTDDKNVWFQEKLKWLMPSLLSLNLDQVLQDISCDSFLIICKGLDNVFGLLSDEEKLTAYNFIKSYLSKQLKNTGNACTADITDSSEYLVRNFRRFSFAATIADLEFLYEDFNLFDVLPQLTSVQIAEATTKSNILYDAIAVARLLSEMQKRPFTEIVTYITTLSQLLQQKNMRTITNASVRDFILKTVYQPLQYKLPTFVSTDYSDWFTKKLPALLASVTQEQIEKFPENIDCSSHEIIIQALSNAFDKMTEVQQTAVFQWAHKNLKAKYIESGSACATTSMSSKEWLLKNYGRFYIFALVEELNLLNNQFNGFDVLIYFTSAQLAQFTVTSRSLENKTNFFNIFEHIPDISSLGVYLDTLNTLSPDLLKNCVFGTDILNGIISLLSEEFKTFSLNYIVKWFQDRLRMLLYHINASIYEEILKTAACDSFQAINKALFLIYDNMEPTSQANIYEVMKIYLQLKHDRKSGISCKGTATDSRTWLFTNIGRFSVFARYKDFPLLYRNFNGFTILDIMTPEQLAEFTVQSNGLNNEETVFQIMYHMENRTMSEIYRFLDELAMSAGEIGLTVIGNDQVRSRMLSQVVKDLELYLSAFTVSDWTICLEKLQLLMPSTNSDIMALFTPDSCDAFQVIIEGLDKSYSFMPQANRKDIYEAIITYLMNQLNVTGSPCTANTSDSRDWFIKYFRKFSVLAPFGELVQVNQHFNEMLVLDDFTITQLADVAILYVTQNNVDKFGLVMHAVQIRKPTDAYDFIIAFQSYADKENITILPEGIRTAMSFAIFQQVKQLFPAFNESQWKDTFQKYLKLIISDINIGTLGEIPNKISCTAFQSVVEGLDSGFSDMTSVSKRDVRNMIKSYLGPKKTKVVGPPCPGRDSADWILKNFKSFMIIAEYSDFTDLNGNFDGMNAVSILSSRQLAHMCFVTDALQNKDSILKILANVDPEELSAFMDQFNERANQINLYSLPNTEVQKVMLRTIFCKLREAFSTFSNDDYVLWFQVRLKLFLAGIDQAALEYLPSNMTCNSFQVIIKAINDVIRTDGYTNGADLYLFARKILQIQLQSTGSACADGVTGDLEWIENNFGVSVKFANYSDLISLKPNFDGLQTRQVLTSVQMSSLAVNSTALSNPDDMGAIFDAIQNAGDTQFLARFLESFNSLMMQTSKTLNSNVKDVMLLRSLQIIAPQFSFLGQQDVNTWLKRLQGFLLGINSAVLKLFPIDMPCENFQAIVKVIKCVYSDLTTEQKEDVYAFQINYLLSQYNTGGSACDMNTSGSKPWLQANLGPFCSFASASVLSGLSLQFNSTSFTKDCSNIQTVIL